MTKGGMPSDSIKIFISNWITSNENESPENLNLDYKPFNLPQRCSKKVSKNNSETIRSKQFEGKLNI